MFLHDLGVPHLVTPNTPISPFSDFPTLPYYHTSALGGPPPHLGEHPVTLSERREKIDLLRAIGYSEAEILSGFLRRAREADKAERVPEGRVRGVRTLRRGIPTAHARRGSYSLATLPEAPGIHEALQREGYLQAPGHGVTYTRREARRAVIAEIQRWISKAEAQRDTVQRDGTPKHLPSGDEMSVEDTLTLLKFFWEEDLKGGQDE